MGSDPLPGAVQSLALGAGFSCALLRGGSVKCWGSDQHGVLGRDTVQENVGDPGLIGPIDFGTSRAVVALSAGWHHACVLFEDGRARCWGKNDRGQLGHGNTDDYGDDPGETLNVLADLPLEEVVAIAAGVSNTCAIAANSGRAGTVHCWGSDTGGGIGDGGSGDFGDDEVVDATRPVPLPGWATTVAAGDGVNCALLLDQTVRCWGSNAFGTRGIGETGCGAASADPTCSGSADLRAVRELGEQIVHSVQLNQAHACALDNRGGLSCWGRNDQSRAGYPDMLVGSILPSTPGPLELGAGVSVLSFGLGMRHGCALDTRRAVRCWGEAGPQLGYGMAQQDGAAGVGGTLTPAQQYASMPDQGVVQLGPVAEGEGNAALRVFAGGGHNCAVMSSGSVRCWGHNESGQLGYGNFSQVGQIGELRSPLLDYERLNQADVCVAPELSGGCSGVR